MLTCDHPIPSDRYNDRVEEHLQVTGFYYAFQIGVVQYQKALVNTLIERWHPDTHTFYLPIGECAVTLEDMALILDLPTDGLPVTGMTMSSFEALKAECLHQFGVAPRKSNCRGCCIKLTWLRDLKENFQLTDEISIQRWSTNTPARLGLDPTAISIAASQGTPQFSASKQFMWVAYAVDRVDSNIIPAEIYMQSVVWSATVPLVSFECIEWHATDRYNYVLSELPMPSQHPLETYMYWYQSKFGDHLNLSNLVGEDNDEGNQDMDEGNQDMDEGNEDMDEDSQDADDDNEEQEPQSPPQATPNLLPQEQPQFSSQYVPQTQFTPSFPTHQQYWGMSQFEPGEGGLFSQLLGFMAADAGQSQYGNQPEFMAGRYSLDARLPCHTSSVASGGFVSVDSSRSEGGRGVLNSQNPNRVSMGPLEEVANTLERETNAYLVDDPDDEDDDEEDEIKEFNEDEKSRNDGQAHTLNDKGKGYNLKIDPPRRSANRYTPSVFKKTAKNARSL
ncbi:hypothetical protein Ahy_A09g045841 [Arachis hypogaea]|uniref:Aminotransferase-like plant mobile domain-containing protein n=1 Tax=Arachis hypogaea TaxID=3818 RepID=A0A445BNB0_ARAHY|nr:hypothetical protein Ahy_A09g045841 [Arachis hypogaea]